MDFRVHSQLSVCSTQENYISAAEWMVEELRKVIPDNSEPARCGLYISTPDAGIDASVALWSEAVEQGPGYANPAIFPWTLPNSPAGYLALKLQIQGPNYTLVGDRDAANMARIHAREDLNRGRIDIAVIAQLSVGQNAKVEAECWVKCININNG